MLRLDRIDLSELADLLDQRDCQAGFLNSESGDVYPVFDGEVVGLQEDGPVATYDADLDSFIPLGGGDGSEVYRDMELFAEGVGDARTRRQLVSALEGPRPMRTFRSVVHSTPAMLGREWNRFGNIRAQLRALDFLGAEHLVSGPLVAQAELDERRAELVESGDALLEGLGGESGARLILLNGLPGVGKSTLARAYVESRPGTLNLAIDVLRSMLGGNWEETAEVGRSLALRIIEAHLESGHDVVVPQLVADPGQLRRFEDAAADFEFVMMLVQGESRLGGQPWQQTVAREELDFYRRRLGDLVSQRPGVPTVQVTADDVGATLSELGELLRDE